MQLTDLFTGALSWRRLIVLLEQLPPTSRLAAVTDVRATWSVTDYLIAQVADRVTVVADQVAHLSWLTSEINRDTKKSKRAPHPEPLERLGRPGQPAPPTPPTPGAAGGVRRQRVHSRDLVGRRPVRVVRAGAVS